MPFFNNFCSDNDNSNNDDNDNYVLNNTFNIDDLSDTIETIIEEEIIQCFPRINSSKFCIEMFKYTSIPHISHYHIYINNF